jgi:proton-dependent oligopeptide transporter, POT family
MLLKQPSFLKLLFLTEMWERFSYYGLRALLVLFLTSKLGFTDPTAYAIYALFAALGYAGPIIGGILADKVLGFKNLVIIGGIVIATGHFCMALVDFSATSLYLGLGMVATGTGLFKGNITNLLGACYNKNDPKRIRGFTLFYVGVNLGSVFAAVLCGYIANKFGWHYGFGLAGIGMVLGLMYFVSNKEVLKNVGNPNSNRFITARIFGLSAKTSTLLGSFVVAVVFAKMLSMSEEFSKLLFFAGTGVLVYLAFVIVKLPNTDRMNMILLMVLTVFFMFFMALEMQLGALFSLFTERNVNKEVFGIYIPAAVSQSINPFSIIVMGPLLSSLFMKLGEKVSMLRFAAGLLTTILCFACLYIGCDMANVDGIVSFGYLFAAISIMGLGELLICPLMHNLYTKLAPENIRGFMLGVLMLALSFSNLAGIVIAKFVSVPDAGANADPLASLIIYKHGFLDITQFSVGLLLLFAILYPILNRILNKSTEDALILQGA